LYKDKKNIYAKVFTVIVAVFEIATVF